MKLNRYIINFNVEDIIILLQIGMPVVAIAVSWATLNEKIKYISKNQDIIREDIDRIKNNHLHHVQEDTDNIKLAIANLNKDIAIIKEKLKK